MIPECIPTTSRYQSYFPASPNDQKVIPPPMSKNLRVENFLRGNTHPEANEVFVSNREVAKWHVYGVSAWQRGQHHFFFQRCLRCHGHPEVTGWPTYSICMVYLHEFLWRPTKLGSFFLVNVGKYIVHWASGDRKKVLCKKKNRS